jgi:hypothetical protein
MIAYKQGGGGEGGLPRHNLLVFVDRLSEVGLNATGHQSFSCHFIGLKINKIVAHLGIEPPHA